MNENPTEEEVRASIVPKSNQLNNDDLLTGTITVTVTKVRKGDKEQPISIEIEGHQPYKPCKTCRRVLIAVWSDDARKWVGQRLTLFSDPDVMYAGVRVGGIRISHMSGLDKPKTFLITQSRGKRSEVTIKPLDVLTPEDAEQIESAKADIAAAESLEALKAIGFVLKQRTKPVQDAVRGIYAMRRKDITEHPQQRDTGFVPDKDPPPDIDELPPDPEQWKMAVYALRSLQGCKEFRETVLPTCPDELRDGVETALAERELRLGRPTE
jgi:hypothetical protein